MTLTRNEKLKRKRGRPRSDGPRTPSGQLSRSTELPADQLARMKRMQLFGLEYEATKKPEAATFIGRLCLGGDISQEQYAAIDRLIITRALYQSSIAVPDSLKRSGAASGSEQDPERQKALEDRYRGAMKVIEDLHTSLPRDGIIKAREQCIFMDHDHTELIGAIRLIGNALQKYYRGC